MPPWYTCLVCTAGWVRNVQVEIYNVLQRHCDSFNSLFPFCLTVGDIKTSIWDRLFLNKQSCPQLICGVSLRVTQQGRFLFWPHRGLWPSPSYKIFIPDDVGLVTCCLRRPGPIINYSFAETIHISFESTKRTRDLMYAFINLSLLRGGQIGEHYPGPRGFSWFFSARENCERAAKRWKHESRSRRFATYVHRLAKRRKSGTRVGEHSRRRKSRYRLDRYTTWTQWKASVG